ncbi:MAG: HypC/HybG/HupF family hydrogenase formation chaperone [Desulfurococcales archaeon]|nr:HypC/HybG/HupF family hydrogenase formation chaperone [Desulfurococcales archaeon]
MCWAVPGVVLEVKTNGVALVDMGDGVAREAVIAIEVDRVKPGSIVMVHAGAIITTINIDALRETFNMKKEMARELAEMAGEDPEEAVREVEVEFKSLLEAIERAKRHGITETTIT